MKKKLILLALLPMLLAGCEFEPDSFETDLKSTVLMVGYNKEYAQEFVLKHDVLKTPSSEFNKDLALFTYGASMANKDKDSIVKFYRDMMFSSLELSSAYDYEPTKDSIAYAIGSRNLNHEKVVLISVRGFNYGAEWSSNLNVGLEGDHAGFRAAAKTLLEDLDDYINTYHHQNSKFIFTGYSRGGAVANMCAKLLMEDQNKIIKNENCYFYTYEAPKGCESYHEYNNVYNIVNPADLVPMIAPAEYGFYRVGKDIVLDNSNVEEDCKNYDETIVIPNFKPFTYDGAEVTQNTLPQTLIDILRTPSFGEQSIDTREKFVNVVQGTADYFLSMFMSLPSSITSKIGAALTEMPTMDVLNLIGNPEGIANFLKPFLDEAHYPYDDAELLSYCQKLSTFIVSGPGVGLIMLYGFFGEDFSRMIQMHYPEVNYPLLEAL